MLQGEPASIEFFSNRISPTLYMHTQPFVLQSQKSALDLFFFNLILFLNFT